jgi:hypothetical protein
LSHCFGQHHIINFGRRSGFVVGEQFGNGSEASFVFPEDSGELTAVIGEDVGNYQLGRQLSLDVGNVERILLLGGLHARWLIRH